MLFDPREDQKQYSIAPLFTRGEKIALVIIVLAVLTALFLLPKLARAQSESINVRWTAPARLIISATGETVPLVDSDITGYLLQYGTGADALIQSLEFPAQTRATTVTALTPGRWYFRVAALYHVSTVGEFSPILSALAETVPSAPPTVLQVVENVGYQLNLGSNNRLYFSRVGVVPLGKECIPGMDAMGKHVIKSRDWLIPDNPAKRPRQVFAACRAQAPF